MAYTYKKRVNTNSKHSINYPNHNPFEKNSKTGGNCTWWAWGRFREVYVNATGKSLSWTAGTGNACAFYRIMGKAGYKRGKTPKPGAIICWGYNGRAEGNPGHVAFVEQVFSNGDIEISQSGWSSGPIANRRITKKSGYKFNYNNDHFNGFIYNKVEFTNPDGTVVTGGGTGTADHPRSWYRKKYGTNRSNVYFRLRELGYSHKGSAAIMGNIYQESGYSTKSKSSDGYGSEGLCQWTGGRLTNLKKFANKKGKPYTDLNTQVEFLDKELKDSYKSLRKRLIKGSDGLHDLCYDFCFTFERPAKWAANMPRRNGEADDVYKNFKKAYGGAGSGEEGYEDEEMTGGGVVDMQKRSSVLYSSDNYEFIDLNFDTQKPKIQQDAEDTMKNIFSKLGSIDLSDDSSAAVPESIIGTGLTSSTEPKKTPLKQIKSKFKLSEALIQAPFVELKLGDLTIGSVKNSLDPAPNHITNLQVKKINGEINQYTVGLVHQIRAGEDPNLLDKVFSKIRYNKINIRYGDCTSGSLFKDVEAIITNIVQNRDYAGSKITYTLYATSACNYVSGIEFNFPSTVDRPSHILRKLLYNSGSISEALVSVFPGMANQSEVEANGWLPTNDTILNIDKKSGVTLLSYISYLVGCMSNTTNSVEDVLRNSNYYLTYEDSAKGSYFKVTEVTNASRSAVPTISVFDVTVGYPDGNDVLSFTVNEDNAWAILYNNGSKATEFAYDVNNNGQVIQMYSNSLFNQSMAMNEIQKNWWTQVINHPIKANLTMRGLLKPINLMDYINIDVVFFGQKHITSGLYTIVAQQDTLDGSGFKTSLDLVRVSRTEGAKYHYGGGTYSGGGGAGGGGGSSW